MLAPHHAEDSELGDRRLAAEDFEDALVFLGGEVVFRDELAGDFRQVRVIGYAQNDVTTAVDDTELAARRRFGFGQRRRGRRAASEPDPKAD